MRVFHAKSPARHFVVAIRQFLILALCTWGLIRFDQPLIWIPLALVPGLHDLQLHRAAARGAAPHVFERRHPRAERALALAYAIPSGISASQFTRWHLDHHAELGSAEDDPKRHYLSPKINARWYKLLYATPALFPIYFRRGAEGNGELSGRRSSGRSAGSGASAIGCSTWARSRRSGGRSAPARRCAPDMIPGLLRLSHRVHAQPARPALRHRPGRSGQVGHADERQLVLGLRVHQLELPPRAPLLPGRAVLPPARAPARARAVLSRRSA